MGRARNYAKFLLMCKDEVWTSEKFSKLLELSMLDNLILMCSDLSEVDSDVIANVFKKLKELSIYNIKINDEQLCSMFSSLLWFKTLKSLDIDSQDLRTVSSVVISNLINNLESAQIRDSQLNADQLDDTFKKMASIDTKLKSVFIGNIAEDVDAHILAEGLNNIRSPQGHNLSISQLNQVYRKMTITTKIQKLSLIEEDLRGINPSLLANAINNIE